MKQKLLIVLSFFVSVISAQDTITARIKTLNGQQRYAAIVKAYAPKAKELSGEGLYYVGLAYYMTEDDANCKKFMDLAIQKQPKDPKAYYIKGFALNYTTQYKEAIPCFSTAIKLKPTEPDYYSGLADAYCGLKQFDEAIAAFKKATQQKNCKPHPFLAIAEIYMGIKDEKKALQAFYVAKAGIAKTTEEYAKVLFNIGNLETKFNNEAKAEQAYLELIALNPNDLNPIQNLIQVYYKMRDYDKALPYKNKLYDAYKKGFLKGGDLQDHFCIEQFTWKDKMVSVYERYEEGDKNDVYAKQIFYVSGADGVTVLKVQTEYSPLAKELGGPKFLLCAYKGESHYNSGVGFNEDSKYQHIRAAAIEFMEKLMK
jgi:tetratricopeptide (TPR) repeat protein